MKFTKLFAGALALGVLAGTVLLTAPSNASQTPEKEAKRAVEHYIEAIKSGNVEEMIKSVKDVRFSNVDEQREGYAQMLKEEPNAEYKVTSIKQIDDDQMVVTVHQKTKTSGVNDLELPVIKENNQWKLLITGVSVQAVQN